MSTTTKLVHVGFENNLALDKVIAIATPIAAPVKRAVQKAKKTERLIDLTNGRRTKTVVFLDDGWVAVIAISPETFSSRASQ
ncbi:MAG: hypothetical protein CL792_00510 [Chloroflexi bacterium]|nr:hypothetical protein [Chloroflexota bacterium]|tara:strand:+ start:8177 stop:8422 length:246 start_codon:yes stop_codon:yes gene_type:complete